MRRTGFLLILLGILVLSVTGCVLRPPLRACFSVIADPNGDPMTRLFNAACSTHYDEVLYPTEIYSFKWSFGDGHERMVYGNVLTTYEYLEEGTYTAELLLIGFDGETSRISRKVTIVAE